MRLAFRIALRFLSSSKGQTILIAFGIAIGISVQIFIGSLIQGLQLSLLDATIGRSSHISVLPAEKSDPLMGYKDIIADLEGEFGGFKAVSPTLTRGAFLTLEDEDSTEQVVFRGFDYTAANPIYKFDEALVEGALPSAENEVVLGLDLAKDNGIAIGDTVELVIPERAAKAQLDGSSAKEEVVVVGFIDLKVAVINKSWIIGNLSDAQRYFEFDPEDVTAIEIQIEEPFEADVLATQITERINSDTLLFDNWKAQNAQLLSGLSGQSTSSYMIQVFVVISVVLGIASVLAITVLQKSRQLGILKAMGISNSVASQVFLWQGFLLGVLGGILGIVLGIGLLWSFTAFALKPDGTPVVPIYINWAFIGLSGMIAIVAATLASVIPAVKSSKLSVIEVIKNG